MHLAQDHVHSHAHPPLNGINTKPALRINSAPIKGRPLSDTDPPSYSKSSRFPCDYLAALNALMIRPGGHLNATIAATSNRSRRSGTKARVIASNRVWRSGLSPARRHRHEMEETRNQQCSKLVPAQVEFDANTQATRMPVLRHENVVADTGAQRHINPRRVPAFRTLAEATARDAYEKTGLGSLWVWRQTPAKPMPRKGRQNGRHLCPLLEPMTRHKSDTRYKRENAGR